MFQVYHERFSVSRLLRGDNGPEVKLLQEWLGLHGHKTGLDGDFGLATEYCVKDFQRVKGLGITGAVDSKTQDALLLPITRVETRIDPDARSLNKVLLAYARRHLAEHPVEIGGQNRGPWVRMYMDRNEGDKWPWCAGFATFVLRQACQTLGVEMTYPRAFGCDYLAGYAQKHGTFIQGMSPAVKAGDFFLVRKAKYHWAHIGIVDEVQGDVITTIEGNTNDEGSPEGYEVCRRVRKASDKDYMVV